MKESSKTGMNALKHFKEIALTVAFILALIAGSPAARADDPASNPFDGKLNVELTPYVWLPTLNGTFRFKLSDLTTPAGAPIGTDLTQTFDTSVGPNSYLSKINFGLMFNGTIRMGPLALYSDLINVNVSGATSKTRDFTGPGGNLNYTFSTGAQSQIVTTLWTIAPSFTIFHAKGTTINLLAGGQFLWLTGSAAAQLTDMAGRTFSVGALKRETYSDFIVGSNGEVGLSNKWSLPYYVDAGFGAPSTWQGSIGVKYGNTALSWRHLQYNAGNASALLQGLTLDGPTFSYTLKL
jgi:hypothetical protein